MHIRLDANVLTLDDLEVLEGAKLDPKKGMWRQVREILARFCFDSDAEDAEKIDYDQALERVGKITLGDLKGLTGGLNLTMEGLGEDAVPPEQDGKSSSPSED